MKLTKEQQKAQEFLTSIYTKAWKDSTFKKALVNNPMETLNKFTGKKANLPKDKKIFVEDQTNSNHIYLNIPAKPSLEDMELNEEQLEMVAGGEVDPAAWLINNVIAPVYSWYKDTVNSIVN